MLIPLLISHIDFIFSRKNPVLQFSNNIAVSYISSDNIIFCVPLLIISHIFDETVFCQIKFGVCFGVDAATFLC